MFGFKLFANTFQRFAITRPSGPSLNLASNTVSNFSPSIGSFFPNLQIVRYLNRNARRPNKANRGKRPVSHARRHEKRKILRSVAYKTKIFGFW